jgi:hypothetical protein
VGANLYVEGEAETPRIAVSTGTLTDVDLGGSEFVPQQAKGSVK